MVKYKSRIRNRRNNRIQSKRKKRNRQKVKVMVFDKIMSDKEISDKEGHYIDEDHYKFIIKENTDGYIMIDGKKTLVFKFRKNVIPKHLCKIGMKILKKPAMKKHDNRGAAAGMLDLKRLPTYVDIRKNKIVIQ